MTFDVRTTQTILGPFLGHVTQTSVKVWLHLEGGPTSIYVGVHFGSPKAEARPFVLHVDPERLSTGVVTLTDLAPDTLHYYSLWEDEDRTRPLNLQGLEPSELRFRTLPVGDAAQIDILVMSCHNPAKATKDGQAGYAVWADLPQIIDSESNKAVRLALLIGDQIYADDWEARLLEERDPQERLRLYLDAYRTFWRDDRYRRVLCSVPSVLIWDDHDIVDGWGSRVDSFVGDTSEFKREWRDLFDSASHAFSIMQASRNPPGLAESPEEGFDLGFTIGTLGFVLMDLRTHRNSRKKQIMSEEQWRRIRTWIEAQRGRIDTLFVASPVVFSHGSPLIEDLVDGSWKWILKGVDILARRTSWGRGLQARFNEALGDIRDDIHDSWGWSGNAERADDVLDYLFQIQNDPTRPLSVVLLSGDIHTSGHATIYSSAPTHQTRSSIPHITSSAVAYSPFNWIVEALYRHATKSVPLGKMGRFSSQVSHHFCSRGVAVLSVRPEAGSRAGSLLKVKYYLEGYPEPRILLFDLRGSSHRENIAWTAQRVVSDERYASAEHESVAEKLRDVTGGFAADLEAELDERARERSPPLDWRVSVVDLMKVLNMDSSLGNRLRLAREWGYDGAIDDNFRAMNVWLRKRILDRIEQSARSL